METKTKVAPEIIALFESEGYENREVSKFELTRRLDAHGNYHREIAGALYVQDLDGQFTINTTGWTLFDLLDYLNY